MVAENLGPVVLVDPALVVGGEEMQQAVGAEAVGPSFLSVMARALVKVTSPSARLLRPPLDASQSGTDHWARFNNG